MNNFADTIRWSLLTNKRQYIRDFVSLCVAYLFLMGAFTGMFTGYSGGIYEGVAESAAGIMILAWAISTAVAASNLCHDLRTKQQLSLYLMLPASNSHKFWARVLIAVIQAFVLSLIALVLSDVAQMLISLLVTGEYVSITSAIFGLMDNYLWIDTDVIDTPHSSISIIMQWLTMLSSIVWGFSSYILGGVVFRKIPLVMTTIVWLLFWMILGLGALYTVAQLFEGYYNVELVFLFDKNITIQLISIAISIGFTAFNLWIAYRVFQRYNLSQNKWINI